MRRWSPERLAGGAAAQLIGSPPTGAGPERVTIDSRDAGPGALFVGLPGAQVHGGSFARSALRNGAWGVLSSPDHLRDISGAPAGAPPAVLLASEDPLSSLQRLATSWRRELGATVIGITGSTGKTSTKNLLYAVLVPHRHTHASRANFNTEIGLPLELLAAPEGTEVIVLEMAMRGAGQIALLSAVAEPDVGVIVSIGPVHLSELGSIEAVAAAKAELISALAPGATAIVPHGEALLTGHLRGEVRTVTFGDGGDVRLVGEDHEHVEIDLRGERFPLEVSFTQAHLRHDLLAAVAAADAVGVRACGRIELPPSPGRGERVPLPRRMLLIDDCYNANPMSVRAALQDLVQVSLRRRGSRRVAVLGDMLELGDDELEFHAALGSDATAAGVRVLVTVGSLASAIAQRFDGEHHHAADAVGAASLVRELAAPGDVILVKGSRGVGLEVVCEALKAGASETPA
ncbi:MAG: UDP-N-acetylmuramoyl-tripeptide--D-alanyl-D-alanine ligase [Solirubrobacteraceae bacterium]